MERINVYFRGSMVGQASTLTEAQQIARNHFCTLSAEVTTKLSGQERVYKFQYPDRGNWMTDGYSF